MNRPLYVVFAGINGAGKSTLYHSNLWQTPDMPLSMPRVNPDDILREMHGDWQSNADNFAAGRVALDRIDGYLSSGLSFNQETTLSGKLSLKTIVRAHDAGYRVFLNYVGVANPSVALRRIEHRVDVGGHGIPDETVLRRYRASLANLSKALDYCEQVVIFDNTVQFKRIAMWANGTLAWWGGSMSNGSAPEPQNSSWLLDAVFDEAIWQR